MSYDGGKPFVFYGSSYEGLFYEKTFRRMRLDRS